MQGPAQTQAPKQGAVRQVHLLGDRWAQTPSWVSLHKCCGGAGAIHWRLCHFEKFFISSTEWRFASQRCLPPKQSASAGQTGGSCRVPDPPDPSGLRERCGRRGDRPARRRPCAGLKEGAHSLAPPPAGASSSRRPGTSEERAARAGSGRGGSGLARRRSLSWRGGETCRADALRGRAAPPGFTPSSAHGLNGQGP